MIIRLLSALALIAGTALVLATVWAFGTFGRIPRWREARVELRLLWYSARGDLRRLWCRLRRHWRRGHVVLSGLDGYGYECLACGIWWPSITAAGAPSCEYFSADRLKRAVAEANAAFERFGLAVERLKGGGAQEESNRDEAPGIGAPGAISGGGA